MLTARPVPFATNLSNSQPARRNAVRDEALTIGFVPTIDCAVLIAARELCLFEKRGLSVRLSKEIGWATIREKLLHGELHAAHAPASMAFAIHCGIGTQARPCLTAFVLSLNGSAITLSTELWQAGVRDAASLGALIREQRGSRIFRFGATLKLGTQSSDLRRWLRSGGIDPERDIAIPIVPPSIIHRQLAEGHLDGFCAAEPWNSMLTATGAGWVVATSAEIAPQQPEAVLLVLEEFAEERSTEHLAIVAALSEASRFCDDRDSRLELIRMLALPRNLDVPEAVLASSLLGPFDTGREQREIADLIVFHLGGANVPDRMKARRVFDQVRALPASQGCRALRPDVMSRVFREDLFHLAQGRAAAAPKRAQRSRGSSSSGADAGPTAAPCVALAG